MVVKGRLSAAFAATLIGAAPAPAAPRAEPTPVQLAIHQLDQETRVAGLVRALGASAVHGQVVFRHVKVVDPVGETVTGDQTVIVWNSRIYYVGDAGKAPAMEAPVVVEGAGRYLSPGLADMHVHSGLASDWLLNLANGVTTVRDMAGFPWLLKFRESVAQHRVLAPIDYVAGPIINAAPLEGYAVVIRDPQDGRRIVRQQAACGYDFIKVHNVVPRPMFDAVTDQAARLGMDVVGHVPHGIPVRYAVQHGMRTMEHVKGFLDDATLQMGDTDYAAVTDGPEVWNTPTLYAEMNYLRGPQAQAILDGPTARYVPRRTREAWRAALAQPVDDHLRLAQHGAELMGVIVGRLATAHAKFLAGTDAPNYDLQVMGVALVEELQMLHAAGLTNGEALRAAMSEPAKAMRMEGEFGRIRPGERADLVLLDANPLEDLTAFRANAGVMAHGYWLDRPALDRALAGLTRIYAEGDGVDVGPAALKAVHARAKALGGEGFVLDVHDFTDVGDALRAAGRADWALRFEALAELPKSGPCAQALW